MMNLKHEVKTIYEVEFNEFDKLVQETYDPIYEFMSVQVAGRDSSYSFNVTGEINDWEDGNANFIRGGNIPTYSNPLLLNVLAADGHIEKGDYVIKVSW